VEQAGLRTLQTYPLALEEGPSTLNIVQSTQISWLPISLFVKINGVFEQEQTGVVGDLLAKLCPDGEIIDVIRLATV
jgi:hypothetical protein